MEAGKEEMTRDTLRDATRAGVNRLKRENERLLAQVSREGKIYRDLAQAFGKKGVQALLIEMALHQAMRRAVQKMKVGEGLVRRCVTEERLGSLEDKISTGSLPEVKELPHTFGNWREEILNYFDYPITNGFVEGKNNRIKTIKRLAYPSREGPEHG